MRGEKHKYKLISGECGGLEKQIDVWRNRESEVAVNHQPYDMISFVSRILTPSFVSFE